MSLQPGTTLGHYQILDALGAGGMATVYKAFQPSLERVVALKVMRAGFADDREFVERFRREAKAIAHLRHPNIVQVFDLEEAGGHFFMAMEFLDGGTLKDRLASDRPAPQEMVAILAQVSDALAYAHGLGIVHRDVKPSNVMLTSDGRAVVTDFGIAKILAGTQHTQTGVGIGTPEYMSPEQGEGRGVDHRADIYSLGVMAYEMFTGRVPFSADTPLAIVLAHIRDPLPLPSSIDARIGTRVELVLLKALAKDPAQRFDDARAFAEALRQAVSADAQGTVPTIVVRPAVPAPVLFGRAWALPAAVLLALALTSGAALALAGGRAADPGSRTGAAASPTTAPTPTASATAAPAAASTAPPTSAPPTTPPPLSTGSARVDPELVSSARLYPAADQPGPELRSISSGGPFGLLVITKATIGFERVASVGPMTLEHAKQPFSVNGTLVTSCCYTAPALPGMYRLQVFGNGRLVAEIQYEVR